MATNLPSHSSPRVILAELLASLLLPLHAQDLRATVVADDVVGTCQYRPSDAQSWARIAPGQGLSPGAEVKCTAGGRVTLSFRGSGGFKVVPNGAATSTYRVPAVPHQSPEPRRYEGGRISSTSPETPLIAASSVTTSWQESVANGVAAKSGAACAHKVMPVQSECITGTCKVSVQLNSSIAPACAHGTAADSRTRVAPRTSPASEGSSE